MLIVLVEISKRSIFISPSYFWSMILLPIFRSCLKAKQVKEMSRPKLFIDAFNLIPMGRRTLCCRKMIASWTVVKFYSTWLIIFESGWIVFKCSVWRSGRRVVDASRIWIESWVIVVKRGDRHTGSGIDIGSWCNSCVTRGKLSLEIWLLLLKFTVGVISGKTDCCYSSYSAVCCLTCAL